MKAEDIKKLPAPETAAFLELYAHIPLGNTSWAVTEKMRSLEQQRDAALMALENIALEDEDYAKLNLLGDRPRWVDKQAFETIASCNSLRSMK